MSIKIASMNFGDCDTILHNTPNGMKNIAEVLGPNGEVYWTSTKELTGVPPLSIRSNGTPLLDYLISGNMSQTGTPTPTTPIQPQECGERTAQLFDENYPNITVDTPRYRSIYVGDGTFTLSTTTAQYRGSANLFFLAGNVERGASTQNNGVWNGNPRTVTAVDGYVTIAYRYYIGGDTSDPRSNDVMLNEGTTALPYEPYGQYKIPISSANTTTNVYLGEVQTTRRVKKLVFDGTENWNKYSQDSSRWLYFLSIKKASVKNAICTHCQYSSSIPDYSRVGVQVSSSMVSLLLNLGGIIGDNTIENFKSYLATQYATGTPVTVWYVLATETTGIVNEPLRKIGDYADTVSMEQAGVQIPTNRGNTVIDVDTTLKPSQMYIKYK